MEKIKVVCVVGATASGKTALSILLAKRFNGEIVSADSRQVYRGMDVGTAKAPRDARGMRQKTKERPNHASCFMSHRIPHHLVDVKNPDEEYNLADFRKDAAAAIEDIAARGKLPIVAGGTGLYVSALLDGWEPPAAKPDPALRKKLEEKIRKDELEKLFRELVSLDPEAAYIVDPKNPRRVVRALEIALATGIPFSAQRKKTDPPYDALKIGITKPREVLCYSIACRVDEMIKNGLIEEVRQLVKKYGTKPVAFDAIGYREIIEFLNGKISLGEAAEWIKKNTVAYAKRQMTWFKKDKEINWIEDTNEADQLIQKFL